MDYLEMIATARKMHREAAADIAELRHLAIKAKGEYGADSSKFHTALNNLSNLERDHRNVWRECQHLYDELHDIELEADIAVGEGDV